MDIMTRLIGTRQTAQAIFYRPMGDKDCNHRIYGPVHVCMKKSMGKQLSPAATLPARAVLKPVAAMGGTRSVRNATLHSPELSIFLSQGFENGRQGWI